jgi:hemerythrin-like metal-binding protein
MNRQLLDPYELGGTPLQLDVQESDFPSDFWEFQRLSDQQNMQFSDTVPHSFASTEPFSLERDVDPPIAKAQTRPTEGARGPFRVPLTGIVAMDFEHEQLMRQLERICRAPDLEGAHADIKNFIKAWNLHHKHEEMHMKAKHYPEWAAHEVQHARLMEKYQFVRGEAERPEGDLNSVTAYVDIVARLLVEHIARFDMKYVQWGNAHPDGVGQIFNP